MKTAEQLIEELGIQDLDTFMESAEFDQLDELSKETLKSYLKKSDASFESGDSKTKQKRAKGEFAAVKGLERKANSGNPFKESIEAIVSAVLDGDQESASAAFSQVMGEKISERMDSIKQEIASGL